MQEIKWNSRRLKSLLTIGAILWVIAGAAVFVLPSQMHNLMYPLAMVIGAANALVMVKNNKNCTSHLENKNCNCHFCVMGRMIFEFCLCSCVLIS
jgi:hypothetical protein